MDHRDNDSEEIAELMQSVAAKISMHGLTGTDRLDDEMEERTCPKICRFATPEKAGVDAANSEEVIMELDLDSAPVLPSPPNEKLDIDSRASVDEDVAESNLNSTYTIDSSPIFSKKELSVVLEAGESSYEEFHEALSDSFHVLGESQNAGSRSPEKSESHMEVNELTTVLERNPMSDDKDKEWMNEQQEVAAAGDCCAPTQNPALKDEETILEIKSWNDQEKEDANATALVDPDLNLNTADVKEEVVLMINLGESVSASSQASKESVGSLLKGGVSSNDDIESLVPESFHYPSLETVESRRDSSVLPERVESLTTVIMDKDLQAEIHSAESQENVAKPVESQENAARSVESREKTEQSLESQENTSQVIENEEKILPWEEKESQEKMSPAEESSQMKVGSQEDTAQSVESQENVAHPVESRENASVQLTESKESLARSVKSQDTIAQLKESQESLAILVESQDNELESRESEDEEIDPESIESNESVVQSLKKEEVSLSTDANVAQSVRSEEKVAAMSSIESQKSSAQSIPSQENVAQSIEGQEKSAQSAESQVNAAEPKESQENLVLLVEIKSQENTAQSVKSQEIVVQSGENEVIESQSSEDTNKNANSDDKDQTNETEASKSQNVAIPEVQNNTRFVVEAVLEKEEEVAVAGAAGDRVPATKPTSNEEIIFDISLGTEDKDKEKTTANVQKAESKEEVVFSINLEESASTSSQVSKDSIGSLLKTNGGSRVASEARIETVESQAGSSNLLLDRVESMTTISPKDLKEEVAKEENKGQKVKTDSSEDQIVETTAKKSTSAHSTATSELLTEAISQSEKVKEEEIVATASGSSASAQAPGPSKVTAHGVKKTSSETSHDKADNEDDDDGDTIASAQPVLDHNLNILDANDDAVLMVNVGTSASSASASSSQMSKESARSLLKAGESSRDEIEDYTPESYHYPSRETVESESDCPWLPERVESLTKVILAKEQREKARAAAASTLTKKAGEIESSPGSAGKAVSVERRTSRAGSSRKEFRDEDKIECNCAKLCVLM